jgi:hypothetical protein
MVLRDMKGLWISIAILVATSFILKKSWYERVEEA